MNSAVYPEEVEHLVGRYGSPRRLQMEIPADLEFFRVFQASLQRRRAEVALVIRRTEGRVLVTTKAFYPAGVYRIPTGGINPGEAVEEALWREFKEETGLEATNPQFGALIEYRITNAASAVRFASYLFILDAPDGEPACSDLDENICGFRELSPADLKMLVGTLSNLGPTWRSWGQWRAVPHQVASDLLDESGT